MEEEIVQEILSKDPNVRRLSDKLAEVKKAPQHVSIYRVPSKLQKVKDDAYNPRVVSIGPLHRNNPNLLAMEEHKWRYTLFTFQQTDKFEDTIKCLQKCTDAFYGSEYTLIKKVRESYAVHLTEIEDRDLAEMMLVDGCFILQLFLRNHQPCDQANDPIFSSAWMLPTLRHDLTLLENQIPFFILEKLYDIIIQPHIEKYPEPNSVASLALKFFQPMYQQEITQDTDTASCKNLLLHLCNNFFPPSSGHIIEVGGPAKPSNQRTIKEGTDTKDSEHLLHLLHNFFRPSSGDPEKPSNQQTIKEGTDTEDCKHLLHLLHNFFRPSLGHINEVGGPAKPSNQQTKKEVRPRKEKKNKFKLCASDLYDGGVQFETGSTDSQLYINFDSRRKVIKIAPLSMDDTTDSLFRNLIAFEQCHLRSSHHIASYVIVMKSLIRSEEDIKLLKKQGIITEEVPEGNYLRDDDFESILNHINLKFFFGQLCDEVNEYSKSLNFYFWYKFKARLRRYMKSLHDKYFSSPWSIIAFLAAAVVFCLTVTQFLRNILGS